MKKIRSLDTATTIAYADTGSGPVVMLVHGFGETASVWNQLAIALEDRYRVIIPDLYGTGDSKRQLAETAYCSLEEHAESLRLILEDAGIEVCTMIGHSMGGYITLAFAEAYPEMLNGFGLFHSTALADSAEKKQVRSRGIEFLAEHGSKDFLSGVIPTLYGEDARLRIPRQISQHIQEVSGIMENILAGFYKAMMARPDRQAILSKSAVPVLFILGEEDKTVNLQETLPQTELPGKTQLHVWKKVAHMGMIEAPEKTAEAVIQFLQHLNQT